MGPFKVPYYLWSSLITKNNFAQNLDLEHTLSQEVEIS